MTGQPEPDAVGEAGARRAPLRAWVVAHPADVIDVFVYVVVLNLAIQMLWVVAAGSKLVVLWLIDIVFGGAVSLGGFIPVTLLVIALLGFAGGRQTSALRHDRPGLKCALAPAPRDDGGRAPEDGPTCVAPPSGPAF